jgi:uncharacterized MnhB-related membrane protein
VIVIALIVAASMLCAFMALRSARLLVSALWLAGASALIALLLYELGAHEIAVVELSVGAGLVTILFVFAISVAGDEQMDASTVIPRPVAIALVVVAAVLLAWFALRQPELVVDKGVAGTAAGFAEALWQQRGLDVLVQIVLIFGGVLGVLGLLADAKTTKDERQTTDDGRRASATDDGLALANTNGHHLTEAVDAIQNPKSKIKNPQPEVER